jgi:protein gp37
MTKIEWTDKTWNPVTGCTKISPGCKNCYAERMSKRLAGRYGYPEAPNNFNVTLHHDKIPQPYLWKNPKMIFTCSMSDLGHESIPEEYVRKILNVIAFNDKHIFQILTKRPKRLKMILDKYYYMTNIKDTPFHNLWLGVSAENQDAANERIPLLLQTPAAVRFVSCEPLLEPIWLRKSAVIEDNIDWCIVGGESGPGARPMKLEWARSLRDQCKQAGVPFFMKQIDKKTPIPTDLMVREWPKGVANENI